MSDGKSSRWRGVVHVGVGVLLGMALVTPAFGHVTGEERHDWKHFIKGQVDKRIDRRAVNVGEAAGGSLAGTYPNPVIAADAVGASEIADGAVGTAALAADSVTAAQIAADAVGASEIATNAVSASKIGTGEVGRDEIATDAVTGVAFLGVHTHTASVVVPGNVAGNGSYTTAGTIATCGPGEDFISGGAYWSSVSPTADEELWIQASFRSGLLGWAVVGGNDTSTDRTLVAEVYCLASVI